MRKTEFQHYCHTADDVRLFKCICFGGICQGINLIRAETAIEVEFSMEILRKMVYHYNNNIKEGKLWEKIEIYGAGCDKYFETLNNMKKAVRNKNIAVGIVEITDGKTIAEMGIVNMPTIRVMGKIVAQGRAVFQGEAMQMLEAYMA